MATDNRWHVVLHPRFDNELNVLKTVYTAEEATDAMRRYRGLYPQDTLCILGDAGLNFCHHHLKVIQPQ